MKQIIICVETSKKANTDVVYINKTIKSLYNADNAKISYVYCEGKSKYNTKMKEINDYRRKIIDSVVIFAFDTDAIDLDSKHNELNKKIEQYCEENGFEYVWFYRDIEDVFLHRTVANTAKKSEASRFNTLKGLGATSIELLSSELKIRHKSNIIMVLDKYLDRK